MEIATGLFGLGGTAAGGCLTYLGTWKVEREKTRKRSERRQAELEDKGREACVDYMTAYTAYIDAAWEFCDRISHRGTAEDDRREAEAYQSYLDAWIAYRGTLAAVQITATAEMVRCSRTLNRAVNDYSDAIEVWRRRTDAGLTRTQESNIGKCQAALDAPRLAFADAARKVFGVRGSDRYEEDAQHAEGQVLAAA